VQRGKRYVQALREMIVSVQEQVARARQQGLAADAIKKAVDLSAFESRFTDKDPVGASYFREWFATPAIDRALASAR
jgi:hypothetical protein